MLLHSAIHYNLEVNKGLLRNSQIGIMDALNLVDPKISEIAVFRLLSSEDSKLILKLLSFRRTRFSLSSVRLRFNLISELLIALSLCSDCHELESIDLEYSEYGRVNEKEIISRAVKDFRKKFGFIAVLKIGQNRINFDL